MYIPVYECTKCSTWGTEATGLLVIDTWFCKACALTDIQDEYYRNALKDIKVVTIQIAPSEIQIRRAKKGEKS